MFTEYGNEQACSLEMLRPLNEEGGDNTPRDESEAGADTKAVRRQAALAELPAAAQLALATMRGAYYNVCAKLAVIEDETTQPQRTEIEEMIARGQELADEIEDAFLRR